MSCYFIGKCRHVSEKCLNAIPDIKLNCSHSHVGQHIVDRYGALYGVEILSRPLEDLRVLSTMDHYFSLMTPSKHNFILMEIANKLTFFNGRKKAKNNHYFINVERFSLLDNHVVKSLCRLSQSFQRTGSTLVVEITERHIALSPYTIEAEYKLKEANILIALDDFTYDVHSELNAARHDYVKFDLRYIRDNRYFNTFVDWAFEIKELGVKIIVECVETEHDALLAHSLPFDYFQGYYYDNFDDL
ncbi:EAL domain-containing protein [Shewanella sp. D64]|nr:EAL domain-containing protein [Shewanella sp. D64]